MCPYLGISIEVNQAQGRRDNSASVDRIDNSKGYVKGNIEIISDKANRMKNSASREELLLFASTIMERYT